MKIMRRFLLVASIFYASQAFAFIPPPGPISPVIDPINDVIETGKALMKKFRTVADQVQYYRDQALDVIKSVQNFVNMDMSESPIQKEEDTPVLAATKEVVESKLGDVKNKEDVAGIFEKLFLNYPMDLIESFPSKQKEVILKKYRDKSVEFSNDSMMELYLTIRDLEDNRLPSMKKELEELSDCFVSGKSGSSALCKSSSDSDEELGNRVNRYKLAELEDSYVRMYEELTALKIQYEAGIALQAGLSPFNADEALDADSTGDKEASSGAMAASMKSMGINLEEALPFEEKTPFAGAQDNLTALPILDAIYDLLSEAQYLHNTKQQLPNLRRPFLEYEKMEALHSIAISKVIEANIKSRDYFKNYYGDADSLWFGDGCSLRKEYVGHTCPFITGCRSTKEYTKSYVTVVLCPDAVFQPIEYDKIRGLSEHAYRLYTASKAEQVLSLNDSGEEDNSQNQIDGVAVVDMDMDTTTPDMDEDMDLEGMVGGGNLTKESDNEYAEGAVREQELNRWQIGSIESTRVGADMNSGKTKYGLNKKYPLWQDEKRFFDQYLREKYKNMELHLNNPIIAKPIFDLAAQMNGDMKVSQEALNRCHAIAQERKQYKFDHVCWDDVPYNDYEQECDAEGKCTWIVVKRCCKKEVNHGCRQEAINTAIKEESDCVKAINDALNKEKNANTGIINSARTEFENNAAIKKFLTSSELEDLKKAQDAAMDALEEDYKQKLVDKFQDRNNIINALNGVMDHLNEAKSAYNDLMGQKKDAENDAVAQQDVVDLGEKKSTENPDTPYITNIPNEAEATKDEKEKEAVQAEQSAKGYQKTIKALEKQADSYRKKLDGFDDDIETIKEDYIKRATEMEGAHMDEMKQRLANRLKEIQALPKPNIGGGTQTIGTIKEFSGKMFDEFKANAIKQVVDAYHSIEALGANKYEAQLYNSTIFPIHTQMISNIQKVAYSSLLKKVATVATGLGPIGNAFEISNAACKGIATNLFATIALNSECDSSKEDSQYFVSLKGKSCDLTAPKRLFADRTPPVREVFHFDSADYDAVVKTNGKKQGLFHGLENPKTTRREFLKLGRAMPKIWEIMLSPNGFVERDVDLEDVLNQEVTVKGKYGIEMRLFVIQMLNKDTQDENAGSEEFFATKGEIPVVGDVGELSVFFKYDHGLTFRETVFAFDQYFDYIAKTKKKIDEKVVKEKKKSMLIRNQVGDYLQFVDIEQTYKTQVAQLKVKVKEGRKTIEDALEKAYCQAKSKDTGYVKDADIDTKFVSSEFVADTEVYESVADCLDQGKNMYIEEAQKMMQQLPELTDYLKERKKKLDNMLKSMQMDKDELVQLSDNTDPDNDLAEKIKSQKADGDVVGRYADEAEEEFENNKNNFEIPYQAKYF